MSHKQHNDKSHNEQTHKSTLHLNKESKKHSEKSADNITKNFEQLREKHEEALALVEQHKNDALRALADKENHQRHATMQIEKAHKFALDRFSKALLPVIDSLEHALDVPGESTEMNAMKEGVKLTLKMFLDAIEKFGIIQINPMGETFDPNSHEAMSMQKDPNAKPNTIINVFQKGYTLNGRLIRPARVIVSS